MCTEITHISTVEKLSFKRLGNLQRLVFQVVTLTTSVLRRQNQVS